jgi:hypothetical protein
MMLGRAGIESIVIDHTGRGRSPHWVKVKNPASPAMVRARDVDWSRKQAFHFGNR